MTESVNNDVQNMSDNLPRPSRQIHTRQFAKILARWDAPAEFCAWVELLDPTLSVSSVVDAIPTSRSRWYWWLNGAIYKRLPELAAGVFNRQDSDLYAQFMYAFDALAYDPPAREKAFMAYKRRAGSLISVMLIYIFSHPAPAAAERSVIR